MVSELTQWSGASKGEVVEEFRTQTILEAALRVIAAKGMAGATMLEIAKEAGIAKATIYLYFESRETLVDRAAELARSQLLAQLEKTLAEPRPFREQLRRLVSTKFEFFHKNQQFFRVYMALRYPEGTACAPKRVKERGVYLGRLTTFFREAMERGEIRSVDPSRIALFFLEGVVALTFQRIAEPSQTEPGLDVDLVVNLMLHGLEIPRS